MILRDKRIALLHGQRLRRKKKKLSSRSRRLPTGGGYGAPASPTTTKKAKATITAAIIANRAPPQLSLASSERVNSVCGRARFAVTVTVVALASLVVEEEGT